MLRSEDDVLLCLISMKNLLVCSIWSWVFFRVGTVEIKMDPGMREGKPSYIYCDVGTVTAGVNFFTEPNIGKGFCLGPGGSCSKTDLYTVKQNTTGVLLEIASFNISNEGGVWYCEHDADRSINKISVNNYTIAGFLLRQNWTEPLGPLDTFCADMTLSCTNQMPNISFTYKDSESNRGTVPNEAVTTSTQSSYNGTTCENENKFFVITLRASYKLDVFNNKTGVTFTFHYYEDNATAPFSVDFLEYVAELTTESPRKATGCDGLCVWEIVIIVVVVFLVTLTVVIIIYFLKKRKKFCFK